jgi:hypothetical protein
MAHEAADFDTTLAAAAGEDLALLEELRAAFVESFTQQIDLLRRSRCDGNWEVAALRLKGLGSSFHRPSWSSSRRKRSTARPGEPAVIRKLASLHERFAARRPADRPLLGSRRRTLRRSRAGGSRCEWR